MNVYMFIAIIVVWLFLGMGIEWVIVNLLGIEPESKVGKGIILDQSSR